MAMNVAGIKMKADKLNDSLWMPKGIVGFNRLRFRTPEFGLPIRMSKTAVTVDTEDYFKECFCPYRTLQYDGYRRYDGCLQGNDERREVDGTFVSYV